MGVIGIARIEARLYEKQRRRRLRRSCSWRT